MGAAVGVFIFLVLLMGGFFVVHGINNVIKFFERGSIVERFIKMWEKALSE
ncbi:hypothetical protein CPT_Silence29 [Bacillus phage Silence]|nr:hypothetical protein CPT_Silence29 [Bacillus phage Silence]